VNDGRHDEAAVLYQRAGELAPDKQELRFWAALGAAQSGDVAGAARALAELEPQWRELLGRLPAEVSPVAPAVRAHLDERS
jgi:hypothetical protein